MLLSKTRPLRRSASPEIIRRDRRLRRRGVEMGGVFSSVFGRRLARAKFRGGMLWLSDQARCDSASKWWIGMVVSGMAIIVCGGG